MEKTVYLHFGRGKTGTTFLQSFLHWNRALLIQHGLDYLPCDGGGGHQQFAKSFITDPPAYMVPPHAPEVAQKRIKAAILDSAADRVLISSENFPLCDLSALRDYLDGLEGVASIKVIFFVRSQDELAESEYNQMVKLKLASADFETYANESLEGVDYYAEAQRFEAVFGGDNLIFGIFDAAKRIIIEQFLAIFDLNRDDFTVAPNPSAEGDAANTAMGYFALRAIRALNQTAMIERPEVNQAIQRVLKPHDSPALLFDSAWGDRFRAQFALSNAAFTRRYLGREITDLGGRRYSDLERDQIRDQILKLERNHAG